jgi:hypothetical protein
MSYLRGPSVPPNAHFSAGTGSTRTCADPTCPSEDHPSNLTHTSVQLSEVQGQGGDPV